MQKKPIRRSRRAVKRAAIVATLRREVACGKYRPGQLLPKQVQLAQRFQVSVLTVQRAMDQLTHEGFIHTRHARGTFVTPHPPHLNRYALIFHSDPTDLEPGGWSQFYATLANEAAKIQHAEQRQIECVYGILEPTDFPHYQRLVARMQAHQYAGLIFASHPGRLQGSPLLDWEGVPRVALMRYEPALPNIPVVQFRLRAWFAMALDHLAARRRRKVAFVFEPRPKSLVELECPPALLKSRGLSTRPEWHLPVPLWSAGAAQIVRLLMRSRDEVPDALVITDDNLVEPVVAGLVAARVRVPEDVVIVAHANFPRSGPSLLPLQWLGYDNHRTLQACLAVIDQQCHGNVPPPVTLIAPVFEEDLVSQQPAIEPVRSR